MGIVHRTKCICGDVLQLLMIHKEENEKFVQRTLIICVFQAPSIIHVLLLILFIVLIINLLIILYTEHEVIELKVISLEFLIF